MAPSGPKELKMSVKKFKNKKPARIKLSTPQPGSPTIKIWFAPANTTKWISQKPITVTADSGCEPSLVMSDDEFKAMFGDAPIIDMAEVELASAKIIQVEVSEVAVRIDCDNGESVSILNVQCYRLTGGNILAGMELMDNFKIFLDGGELHVLQPNYEQLEELDNYEGEISTLVQNQDGSKQWIKKSNINEQSNAAKRECKKFCVTGDYYDRASSGMRSPNTILS